MNNLGILKLQKGKPLYREEIPLSYPVKNKIILVPWIRYKNLLQKIQLDSMEKVRFKGDIK